MINDYMYCSFLGHQFQKRLVVFVIDMEVTFSELTPKTILSVRDIPFVQYHSRTTSKIMILSATLPPSKLQRTAVSASATKKS